MTQDCLTSFGCNFLKAIACCSACRNYHCNDKNNDDKNIAILR